MPVHNSANPASSACQLSGDSSWAPTAITSTPSSPPVFEASSAVAAGVVGTMFAAAFLRLARPPRPVLFPPVAAAASACPRLLRCFRGGLVGSRTGEWSNKCCSRQVASARMCSNGTWILCDPLPPSM
eukprot:GHRR01036673.1.p2 GENE.GHRR01036673.1~~GHRR01036673.1.p2  ORF type:complete len:128 (-),score=33.22 GHRR01036673.1:683-1066(-)